jgi:hypothetical protein
MIKIIIIALFGYLVIIEAGPECTFDKDCTANGVVNLCVNGKCELKNKNTTVLRYRIINIIINLSAVNFEVRISIFCANLY